MYKKNKGFTTIELITSFTLASVIMLILFNIILILKDNLSEVNAKTNMLVEKDNLSYNINKRFKEKELSSITMCDEGDKCYEFKYSDDTSDKLVYNNTDKTITFNNYTFDIIDGITVEEPTITEHYDTMSSTKYNGYFIINIPIKLDDKDYSIKVNKHFNTDSLVIDFRDAIFDNNGNRYTLVDYLEGTGTQYIDTQVKPYKTMIEIQFSLSDDWNINEVYTGAGSYGDNNNRYIPLVHWDNWHDRRNSVIGVDKSANEFVYINNPNINEKYTIKYNDYENKCYFNNNYIKTISDLDDDNNNTNIYLFAYGVRGEATSFSRFFKLHYVKITDKNIEKVLRDYIPVIDSTERPCLFDKVEKKCYYNQGTGEFLYG